MDVHSYHVITGTSHMTLIYLSFQSTWNSVACHTGLLLDSWIYQTVSVTFNNAVSTSTAICYQIRRTVRSTVNYESIKFTEGNIRSRTPAGLRSGTR